MERNDEIGLVLAQQGDGGRSVDVLNGGEGRADTLGVFAYGMERHVLTGTMDPRAPSGRPAHQRGKKSGNAKRHDVKSQGQGHAQPGMRQVPPELTPEAVVAGKAVRGDHQADAAPKCSEEMIERRQAAQAVEMQQGDPTRRLGKPRFLCGRRRRLGRPIALLFGR